ncbi:hypothetical protein PBRA_003032 [Plasmodiophora brassicae]|uniref:Alpha-1,3-glucosyltransferase n=1 Tax=Plasmodiophora brassicae TaxID=37360 RepID=A0A0G4J6Y0_PLABS|nr:hypothetical protein PBRA_003032 [Plasmodiophora brassicae]
MGGAAADADAWQCTRLVPWLVVLALTCFKCLLMPSYRSTDFDVSSGERSPVHRNWLAITSSLPISQWYTEVVVLLPSDPARLPVSQSTSEWTLDYPPFFAWFEYVLAQFAGLVDPAMLVISAEPYASPLTIVFQRLSVVVTDFMLIVAVALYCRSMENDSGTPSNRFIVLVVTITNAGLIIVDRSLRQASIKFFLPTSSLADIHFQYNGFLLGILVLSVYFIVKGRDLAAGITFAMLLNFKHIFAYVAPLYFVYLLRHYCFPLDRHAKRRRFSLQNFASLGASVIVVFGLSFGPFAVVQQIPSVLGRLFPVKRGLTHAYWAPNFWSLYNALDRALIFALKPNASGMQSVTRGLIGDIHHIVLPAVSPTTTVVLTVASMVPALISGKYMFLLCWQSSLTGRNPYSVAVSTPIRIRLRSLLRYLMLVRVRLACSREGGPDGYDTSWVGNGPASLTLIATNSVDHARTYTFLNLVGNVSLVPLLHEPLEAVVRVCLVFAHSALAYQLLVANVAHRAARFRIDVSLTEWTLPYAVYVAGLLAVLVVTYVQPLVLPAMQFLPLMLISVYCGIGVCFSLLQLFRLHLFDVRRSEK